MNQNKIVCPNCQNTNKQILISLDLEGGHRTDWQAHEEWNFARALLYMTCAACGTNHEIKLEWRD